MLSPLNTPLAAILKISGQIAHAIAPQINKRISPNYCDQQANDYVRHCIQAQQKGLMIMKFGTYELKAFLNFYSRSIGLRRVDITNMLRYRYVLYRSEKHSMDRLHQNAGFFPNNISLGTRYAQLVAEDWTQVDILGSYQKEEYYPFSFHANPTIKTVNLEGYCAPFLWKNPWTSCLKGKRVLVVSPFASSIKKQYNHRALLFDNPEALPEFEQLLTIKAVQSIAGNECNYNDWFEALEDMKQQMDQYNYDVALIGCGAYGMHLAAHAKRRGKVGIHLGGMTQMLFGIYGERWINDPVYKPFIRDSWTRPTTDEKPQRAETIENGCYW